MGTSATPSSDGRGGPCGWLGANRKNKLKSLYSWLAKRPLTASGEDREDSAHVGQPGSCLLILLVFLPLKSLKVFQNCTDPRGAKQTAAEWTEVWTSTGTRTFGTMCCRGQDIKEDAQAPPLTVNLPNDPFRPAMCQQCREMEYKFLGETWGNFLLGRERGLHLLWTEADPATITRWWEATCHTQEGLGWQCITG